MDSLKHFFEPDRVALIGATEKFGFGYGHTKTLVDQNLGDRLFLINPSQTMILGKKTYPRIAEVPADVDLAVLLVLFSQELSEFQREEFDPKPFLFSVVGKRELRAAAIRVLGERIPIISSPENAARALASMVRYQLRYPR